MLYNQILMDLQLPGFSDVEAAAQRLAGHVVRTPVLRSPELDRRAEAEVHVKCENLQRGGAFKFRGAMNRLLQLTPAERRRGVVAYSSGNHAMAVALAAQELGISAALVMPADAPHAKLDAVRAAGGTVHLYEREGGNREAMAAELVAVEDRVLVPPFDDAQVIAGAGTAALELLEAVPDLEAVLVPVGGGGLLAGTALAAHGMRAEIAVYGVEPTAAADAKLSLERGAIMALASAVRRTTIADGLRTAQVGQLTFPIIREHAAGIATVADFQLVEAMRLLLFQMKILAEPSGAAAVAAVMRGGFPRFRAPFRRVGVVVSGGNLDAEALTGYLATGGDDDLGLEPVPLDVPN